MLARKFSYNNTDMIFLFMFISHFETYFVGILCSYAERDVFGL